MSLPAAAGLFIEWMDSGKQHDLLKRIQVYIWKEGFETGALKGHLYEEVAHYIHLLENENQEIGSGMIGELSQAMTGKEFLIHLKQAMDLQVIKHTKIPNKPIRKIAVCGGSGGFLLRKAIAKKADIFITADYKYHEFFDADNQIIIADIGHFESEQFTSELFSELISEKFSNFAVHLTTVNTNPVQYFF